MHGNRPTTPAASRARTPALVYSALSVAILVVLASVSVTSRKPPAPAIAEVEPGAGRAGADDATTAQAGGRPTSSLNVPEVAASPSARTVTANVGGVVFNIPLGAGRSGQGGGGAGGRTGTAGRPAAGPGAGTAGPGGGSGGAGGDEPGGEGESEPPAPPVEEPAPATTATTAPPSPTTTTTVPGATTTSTPASTEGPPQFTLGKSTIRCVGPPGGPFRQIEDPQSPPCRGGFAGDNGGDLDPARGITRNEVRIAVFNPGGAQAVQPEYKLLESFFNSRYELWGRKLNFVPLPNNGSAFDVAGPGLGDAPRQREQAGFVAGQRIFASTNLGQTPGTAYLDELARYGIVSVSSQERGQGEPAPEFRPYQWGYQPDIVELEQNLGQWMCNQLAPNGGAVKPAAFAGPGKQNKPRKFAILYNDYADGTVADIEPLRSVLDGCGVKNPPELRVTTKGISRDQQDVQLMTRVQSTMAQWNADDVTTVVCICKATSFQTTYQTAATDAGFYPEWLVSTFGHHDIDHYSNNVPPPADQQNQALGVSFHNEWGPVADLPVDWAVKEVNAGHKWAGGFDNAHQWAAWRYPALQLIAAGIQMAGPNLNAQTFAQGLRAAAWPNPRATNDTFAARARAGRVGFNAADDFTFVDDASLIWWGTNFISNQDGVAGTWCHSYGTRRFAAGQWPKEDQPPIKGPVCRAP